MTIYMDEIIQNIIKTDHQARKIIDEARKERESHESDMAKEIEDYKYNAFKDIWEKIDGYTEEQNTATAEKIRLIEESAQSQIAGMKEKADRNRDEWVKQLFEKVLAGEIG